MHRMHPLHLNTDSMSAEEAEQWGTELAEYQRAINWWLGDLAVHARKHLGDNYTQVFPEWVSPGLIQRCEAVSKAYAPEERNQLATWTIHMKHANHPQRIQKVQEAVDAGRTSDEERRAEAGRERQPADGNRWLLAVDVNYFLHRFWYSGAGVEAAASVATWVQRTAARLQERGLTDVACCLDSPRNHRKELTTEWEDKYKDRPPKDPELGQQLNLVHELLKGHGFACVKIDGYEADDVMASFAVQFPGKVTLLTQDKDCRQCLSSKCNMLLDVEWIEDETSGEMMPEYKWVSAKQHTDETGIPPEKWTEFQALMGDATDGIKGAAGIGKKGAADLVQEFGSVEAAIEAAKSDDDRINPAKRKSLIEFEPKLDTTRKLVTLHSDLTLPTNTRI